MSQLIVDNKIEQDSAAPRFPAATNTTNVGFGFPRKVVVDDESDKSDVDDARQQISRDQNARQPRSELFPDGFTLRLFYPAPLRRQSEIITRVKR